MANLLITGGKGFIASHLMAKLRAAGHDVESFDIADGQDLRSAGQVMGAVRGKAAVFHLAAVADLNWARVHPIDTMEINVKGTWNVAFACQKSGARLYYASTCCVYGNQEHHPVHEAVLPNPAEIYACSKLAGENIIKGFHYTYGLPYAFMRFATIYGPGTRSALGTHIFIGQALRGNPITVHGDGGQTRTLTHIDDLVNGIHTLFESGRCNDVWNLTATEEISALRMANDVKRITGSDSPIVFVPQRVGQTFRESISAAKAFHDFGWQARVNWEQGLTEMIEWYRQTNQAANLYDMPTDEEATVPSAQVPGVRSGALLSSLL